MKIEISSDYCISGEKRARVKENDFLFSLSYLINYKIESYLFLISLCYGEKIGISTSG